MDTVPFARPPYFRCDLGKKAARATVIQTSVLDEINSSDNHSHDVIHSLHFSEKSKNHAPLLSNFHTTQSHSVGWTWPAVWDFILANTVSLNAGLVFWNLHNCLMWHTTCCTMLKPTSQGVCVCASVFRLCQFSACSPATLITCTVYIGHVQGYDRRALSAFSWQALSAISCFHHGNHSCNEPFLTSANHSHSLYCSRYRACMLF